MLVSVASRKFIAINLKNKINNNNNDHDHDDLLSSHSVDSAFVRQQICLLVELIPHKKLPGD